MIVVGGEALVDLIPTPSGDLGVHPGGGPFNTARWLGRLGMPVGFLGALADDPLGRRLRDSLTAARVSLQPVVETKLPTTLALTQLDDAGAARYSFYADGTSMRDIRPEQIRLPHALDALCVGSIGLMLEPIASAMQAAVALARQRGALVIVDPNVRATLIDDRACYLDRLRAVLRQTDVLKLSVEDAAWLMPGQPLDAVARTFGECGPRVVLLTEGANGASVFSGETTARLPAAPVAVVDTIGAGDAFSAGFMASWLSNDRGAPAALLEATAFAVRVAGLACSVRGATPPANVLDRLPDAGPPSGPRSPSATAG
jgi:fructokinase